MYATRARRARPEPFAVRPGIAERLGLPYMDGAARLLRRRPGRLQRLHPRPGDRARRARQPRLLRRPPGDLRGARHRRHVPALPGSTTRASASCGSASTRFLCVERLARLRLRLRRARLAALLRTSLLQLPAIGARQAPASACACRVRDRWRQARLAEAAHGALPLPRPGSGCARLPAAGPRHLIGVRGRSPSP